MKKRTYRVGIQKAVLGFIDVEARSKAEALQKASVELEAHGGDFQEFGSETHFAIPFPLP